MMTNFYEILNENCCNGDILNTLNYGEVTFLKCENGKIICNLDGEYKVYYNKNGQQMWFSEKDNCWKYDDESLNQIVIG